MSLLKWLTVKAELIASYLALLLSAGNSNPEYKHFPRIHVIAMNYIKGFSWFCVEWQWVAWPSGPRRWFKAPVSSGAWVRIPPLPASLHQVLISHLLHTRPLVLDRLLILGRCFAASPYFFHWTEVITFECKTMPNRRGNGVRSRFAAPYLFAAFYALFAKCPYSKLWAAMSRSYEISTISSPPRCHDSKASVSQMMTCTIYDLESERDKYMIQCQPV